jgi:hypothetical protein
MTNVPQANPEPQLIAPRDLPPVLTTSNGKRKGTPPSEAEVVMLAELESYRADSESPGASDSTTTLRQRHIPIKRPAPDTWVRVDPEWTYPVFLYQPSRGMRDPYVVLPTVVPLLDGKAKAVDLRLAVDADGVVFFWPSPRGEEFAAHLTEREAIDAAMHTWVRMFWNVGTKAFDFVEAPTTQPLPEPGWPTIDAQILLGRALDKKKIASPEHPVVKALLTPGG